MWGLGVTCSASRDSFANDNLLNDITNSINNNNNNGLSASQNIASLKAFAAAPPAIAAKPGDGFLILVDLFLLGLAFRLSGSLMARVERPAGVQQGQNHENAGIGEKAPQQNKAEESESARTAARAALLHSLSTLFDHDVVFRLLGRREQRADLVRL